MAASVPVKIATILLAGLAAGLAALLLYQSQSEVVLAGCGGDSGCDAVLNSKWATWFGIPVSLPAMLVYVGMLGAALGRDTEAKYDKPALDAVMALCGAAAIIAAVWFVVVQVVFVGSFCIYCLSTHAAGVAAGVLCLLVAYASLKPGLLAMASGSAAALVAVLIVGQLLSDDPEAVAPQVQYVEGTAPAGDSSVPDVEELIKSASNDPLSNPLGADPITPGFDPIKNPAVQSGTDRGAAQTQRTGPRRVKLYGGRIEIDTTTVPVIGDPYAPTVLGVLFDYTCHHCRETRKVLEKTKQKHDDLVIVCLPTPLNSRCNRLIRVYNSANRYSCDLSEVSLAVWHAAPEKWAEWDRQMYSAEQDDLTPAKAKIAAWELIGEKTLDAALNEPWIKQQMQRDVTMYGICGKASGSTLLPMLFTTRGIMNGSPRHPLDIDDLIEGKPIAGGAGGHEGHEH